MPIQPLDLREAVWVTLPAANSFAMFVDSEAMNPLRNYHSILRTEVDAVLLPGLHQAVWEKYVGVKTANQSFGI